ncbi:hypothetical protein JZU69_00545, partial [bacterium]|nr:hypothetical protein [bacterium]
MKTTVPCGLRRGLCLAAWLLALPLLLAVPAAQGFEWLTLGSWPYLPQNGSKHGAVYARQLVPGPQGQPVYVEFDPATGAEGREIGEAVGRLAGAQVLAASAYRAWLTRLTDLRQRYPALELVDAADYRGASYATAAGQAIAKPRLAAGTLWVALRPPALRYTPDPAQLVLLELPIDPHQTLGYTSAAVLLDPQTGAILHQSANNIGYRVGFYGDAANPKVPYRGNDWRRDPDDLIYGPLAGVPVEIGYGLFGAAVTDDQGKYHAGYRLPPCPGFTFEYSTPVNLELHYSRFNPRGSRTRCTMRSAAGLEPV